MTNIIKEVFDDGTEREFDVDVCAEVASDAFDVLVEAEESTEMYDFGTAVLCVFIECIHALTSLGFTEQTLVNEVFEHSEQYAETEEVSSDAEEEDEEEDNEGVVVISHRNPGTVH